MNVEPQIYTQHLDELRQLVQAHLERGSLDEGNSEVFDDLIDAWLDEELARLDEVLPEDDDSRATAAADADQRRRRAAAAQSRQDEDDDARRTARAKTLKVRVDLAQHRLSAATDRLARAEQQLESAHRLLVGVPTSSKAVQINNETGNGPEDGSVVTSTTEAA